MAEIMRFGRKQPKGTNSVVVIRGVRLNSLKPKLMNYDEFKTMLSTVTVRECQLILTLRSGGLNQDEILFFDHAMADPRAIDAVFDLLLQRMKNSTDGHCETDLGQRTNEGSK